MALKNFLVRVVRVKTFFKYHILRYLRKIPFIWGSSSCIFWFFAIRGQKSDFSSHIVKIKKLVLKVLDDMGLDPSCLQVWLLPRGPRNETELSPIDRLGMTPAHINYMLQSYRLVVFP